jgi:hypothetical protein
MKSQRHVARLTLRDDRAIKRAPARAMRGKRSSSPTCVLQNDAVAVGIFERFSLDVPVRVERLDGWVAELLEALRGFLPLRSIGNVKHQKIVLAGRFPGGMPTLARELEVVSRSLMTEHDTIEAVVILKFIKNFEAEPVAIKFHDRRELIGGSRHPQVRCRETHRNVMRFSHRLCQARRAARAERFPSRRRLFDGAALRGLLA